ncbi:MAG: hypothetical protein AB1894_21760 [Chloroflexota bacterium]
MIANESTIVEIRASSTQTERKPYSSPQLIEEGTIFELTQGDSGPFGDFPSGSRASA